MAHHDAIDIEVALKVIDGMRDDFRRDERAGTIVHGDNLVFLRKRLEAVHSRLLTLLPGRRKFDGRHERIRIDGLAAVLGLTLLRAHDDDDTDIGNGIEGLGRPREHRLTEHFEQLLATGIAEALALAAGDDNGSCRRVLGDMTGKQATRVLERVDLMHVQVYLGWREGRRDGNRVDTHFDQVFRVVSHGPSSHDVTHLATRRPGAR